MSEYLSGLIQQRALIQKRGYKMKDEEMYRSKKKDLKGNVKRFDRELYERNNFLGCNLCVELIESYGHKVLTAIVSRERETYKADIYYRISGGRSEGSTNYAEVEVRGYNSWNAKHGEFPTFGGENTVHVLERKKCYNQPNHWIVEFRNDGNACIVIRGSVAFNDKYLKPLGSAKIDSYDKVTGERTTVRTKGEYVYNVPLDLTDEYHKINGKWMCIRKGPRRIKERLINKERGYGVC